MAYDIRIARGAVTLPKSSESANLDLLRTVAVLCVFGSHLTETIIGKHMELIWHIGRLGVLMFFVHTSLVLMFSMERLPLKGWDLIKSFYVRRAFRIYPLSMLCVMVYYGSQRFGRPPVTGRKRICGQI